MDRIKIISDAITKQFKDVKKLKTMSYTDKRTYFDTANRLDYLVTLFYFLTLKPTIKKLVLENYLTLEPEQLITLIVSYENSLLDVEFGKHVVSVYDGDLNPLILQYIKDVVNEIESKTLTLF